MLTKLLGRGAILTGLLLVALMANAGLAFGAEEAVAPVSDSGDTAWMIVATALVMLMTPGLALFYGGMVRAKNALSTLMMSFAVLCVITVQWVVLGYSLAFGTDVAGIVGGLDAVGLAGLSGAPGPLADNVPGYLVAMFQGMFAIITVALITGGLVGRVKFSALLVFGVLWTTIVYDPLAHWVWGGGFIGAMGALDFAGGTVVHISAGVAALVVAIVLGARKGYRKGPVSPHSIPMTVIGAALLWFGWFGFNAGSGLAADGLASSAFLVTQIAAASAAITWMLLSWNSRKPSVLGIATGAIAGLVAITPAAGFVNPIGALIIGAVAGLICYYAVMIRTRSSVDDSLDVFAIHGVAGIWGAVATGVFADPSINPAGTGLLYGNAGQVLIQIEAVAVTVVFVAVATFVIAKIVDATIGLRVSEQEERVGLDLSQHGEIAYDSRYGGAA